VLFNFRIELKGESLRNDCIKQEKQKLNEFKGIIAGLNFKTTPKHNTDNAMKNLSRLGGSNCPWLAKLNNILLL
jgi:hypothetical protein